MIEIEIDSIHKGERGKKTEWRTVTRGGKTFKQRFRVGQKDVEIPEDIEPSKILMRTDNIESMENAMEAGLPESTHGTDINLVKFKDGGKGIHKTTGDKDDITGETGYHDVAEVIGWNIVPQTEVVDFGLGMGTCQRFVKGQHLKSSGDDGIFAEEKHFDSLAKIFALDLLVGNSDRHDENIIIDKNGKVWAIDNDTWVQNAPEYYSNDIVDELDGLDYHADGEMPNKGEGFSKLCESLSRSLSPNDFKRFRSVVKDKISELLNHTDTIKDYYRDSGVHKGGIDANIEQAKEYIGDNK